METRYIHDIEQDSVACVLLSIITERCADWNISRVESMLEDLKLRILRSAKNRTVQEIQPIYREYSARIKERS